MTSGSKLELKPLVPSRLDDWLAFFEGEAFADNPEWGACYCRCFVFGGGGFDAWDRACTAGENKAPMVERVREGSIDGLLAYRDGAPIGWVHYGPTARFHTPRGPLAPADEGVASIVCFIVAAEHRRTGVARALLRGSLAELGRAGFHAVDARPRIGEHSAAEQFTGPLALYLSEGFREVEPLGDRVRVRRQL